MFLRLTEKWVESLLKMPEAGMGYQKVDIVLKNGRRIGGLVVHNAEVLELPKRYEFIKENDIRIITLHEGKQRR